MHTVYKVFKSNSINQRNAKSFMSIALLVLIYGALNIWRKRMADSLNQLINDKGV